MGKKFSERIGASPPRSLQLNSMDVPLRNSLWNAIIGCVGLVSSDGWQSLARNSALDFFKWPVDSLPDHRFGEETRTFLRERFYKLQWYEVYDFVEYIVQKCTKQNARSSAENRFNRVLEGENSAYRFVGGFLVPISNEAEAAEIAKAVEDSDSHGLAGVNEHLTSALRLLGQKPDPDFRNAIKESISAVESICKRLAGDKSGGLEAALAKLSAKTPIHGGLKSAFGKLYGYTSDEQGIRHAMLEEAEVGFDEAKFMVVSCSAFLNYLIGKAISANLF